MTGLYSSSLIFRLPRRFLRERQGRHPPGSFVEKIRAALLHRCWHAAIKNLHRQTYIPAPQMAVRGGETRCQIGRGLLLQSVPTQWMPSSGRSSCGTRNGCKSSSTRSPSPRKRGFHRRGEWPSPLISHRSAGKDRRQGRGVESADSGTPGVPLGKDGGDNDLRPSKQGPIRRPAPPDPTRTVMTIE